MKNRWDILIKLINENKFEVIAEIGVEHCEIGRRVIKECPSVKHYICVDKNKIAGEEEDAFILSRQCIFVNAYSHVAARFFSDKCIDLVFIDASHDYDSIKSDVESWIGKIKSGGIISGHDYCENEETLKEPYGVYRFINEKFKDFNLELDERVETVNNYIWWKYIKSHE